MYPLVHQEELWGITPAELLLIRGRLEGPPQPAATDGQGEALVRRLCKTPDVEREAGDASPAVGDDRL
jgi:hypothetical protein